LIYGRHFAGVEAVIPVLMLAVFFDAMNQSVRQIYDGAGKRWTNLGMYIVWAMVYFFACIAFIPKMGAIGFALAHLIAEAVLLVIQALYVDFILAPMVLRRHIRLFVFSLSLLGLAYITHSTLSGIGGASIMSGLFLLGLAPILMKLRIAKA
jgi:O-antigen/teichoic acid export membrane protein